MRQNGSNTRTSVSPAENLLELLEDNGEYFPGHELCQPTIPKGTFPYPVRFFVNLVIWNRMKQLHGKKAWFYIIQTILDETRHGSRRYVPDRPDLEIRTLEKDSEKKPGKPFHRIEVEYIKEYGKQSANFTMQ